MTYHQLLTTCHQPLATNYQLPTTNYLLLAGDGSLTAFRLHPGAEGGLAATPWPEHGGTAVGVALRTAGELNAAPALGDLDGDGVVDLLVGLGSGELRAYRNVGSEAAPTFVAWDASYEQDGLTSQPYPYPYP